MDRRFVVSFFFLFFFAVFSDLTSENYIVSGRQKSKITYSLSQQLVPQGRAGYVKLSFVVPETFISPTYTQKISNFRLDTEPSPLRKNETRDKRGNRIIEMVWENIEGPLSARVSCTAENTTTLQPLRSTAGFPVPHVPEEVSVYLRPSAQVQSGNAAIAAKAADLTADVSTQFDAVQRIITWVIDHMRYVTPPEKYDAAYSFSSGLGNCQNYSHLAAALGRAAGIPVRIVNGVTLKEPFTMKTGQGEFTFKMGQGRHSWIEIFFPDMGWVPFDPQQTQLFVSNRFIRIETGVDNRETENDGVVRYKAALGTGGRPQFQEVIEADFPDDQVELSSRKQKYGPKSILLGPEVAAAFTPVLTDKEPPPREVPVEILDRLTFDKRTVFGNLNFPRNTSFLQTRDEKRGEGAGEMVLEKNFMVETAEYVTTKMLQYAQIIIVSKPLRLTEAALALHKFGGSGQVWVELMADNDGRPGDRIAVSGIQDLRELPVKTGYDWVDFSFKKAPPVLSPGRYWIALGFTGSPILNWFYTYGKPVGPMEGTRYKSPYDEQWSGALAYEFNYRISGWTNR